MIDGYYTLAELKELGVKIHRSTLYRMEAAGIIKFKRFKERGKLYINLEELKNAMK